MPHPDHEVDVWAVEGRFQHLIYSPKGDIEGLLIATDGVPTQFVSDPHDRAFADQAGALREGQAVVVEGTVAGPSPKGEPAHCVYTFVRLAEVDGQTPEPPSLHGEVHGAIVRFNYARHGAANGVILDTGDFVHTRPEGLEKLGLQVGDKIRAEGSARPLVTGSGRVIEARSVNGRPCAPGH